MNAEQNGSNNPAPSPEHLDSPTMVKDGEKLQKGDEYLTDDGKWSPLEPIWIGVTYTKWLMVPMRRPTPPVSLLP